MRNIIVLGGYGNFGKRICETMAGWQDIIIMVAGRDLLKAQSLCKKLQPNASAQFVAIALDIHSADFLEQLKSQKPFLVIHTSGPFQGQDYRVPLACIAAGSHYIDLADDRRFVCDISSLHSAAQAAEVSIISGASSVPGLSSCVIDHFLPKFARVDEIDFAIAPGNRAERGEATVKAILSYTGRPIKVFRDGQWKITHGWMSPRKMDFGGVVGERWLANVDVPDLELFPACYAPVRSVSFQAGLELRLLHWGMVSMAWLAKKHWIKNWAAYVKPIVKFSRVFVGLGSDIGGMQIHMRGLDHQSQPQHLVWTLFAENGVGPYIPTLSALILAKRLLQQSAMSSGAGACLGLYGLEEFDALARHWGIYHHTQINGREVACG